ncbi:MAG: hypothetical protein AAB601_00335 [Patescibacteria group bacterium]
MVSGKKTVLVIVSDTLLRTTITDKLSQKGFGTLHAADCAEGVALAVGNLPDLIVFEGSPLSADGISLVKRVRGYDWGRYLPLVVLSSTDEPADLSFVKNGDGPLFFFHASPPNGDDIVREIETRLAGTYPTC